MSSPSLKSNPDCEDKNCHVKRIVSGGSGLIFKGPGFYLTDYKNKKNKSNSESSTDLKTAKEKKIMEDYKKSLEILHQKYKVREKEIKRVNRAELKKTIEENEKKPIEEIADDFAKRFNLERV